MNWVDKGHLRDRAVKDEAEIVWGNLCAAIKDAVYSFNRAYRQSKTPLVHRHGASWVTLSFPSRVSGPRFATARIFFDRERHLIYSKLTKSPASEVTISFDASEDHGQPGDPAVFLRNHLSGENLADEEAASQLLLQDFLKGIENVP